MTLDDLMFKPEVEKALFEQFSRVAPLAAYNTIPYEYDDNGEITNLDVATEATEFGQVLLNLRPDLNEHILISNLANGSGKSVALAYTLALLLTDSHPTVDHKGIDGDIWLITNTDLLKTEYTKFLFESPGILGNKEESKTKNGTTILLPDNTTARIKAYWSGDGLLERIENVTNNKKILCYSFNQGDQSYAGKSPLVVCIDEMGERSKKRNASNTFTEDKMAEIINRVGRSYKFKGKWLIIMTFTIIFEEWVRKLIRTIKKGEFIIPEINPDRQCAKLVQGKMSNPYLNMETINVAKKFYQIIGREDQIRIRHEGRGDEDPFLVFPEFNRPKRISVTDVRLLVQRAKNEKGWEFFEGIDPGWSDVCAVNFFLAHPIEGLFMIDEIYANHQTVNEIAALIRAKEDIWGIPSGVKRIFDPNYIKMTRMESEGLSNLKRWRKEGISGVPCPIRGRSYDSYYTLIKKDLLKYSEICKNYEMELENHKKDEHGIPLEKDVNHSHDATRYVINYYYMHYFKKYHTDDRTQEDDLTPMWKKQYQLEKQHALASLNKQNNSYSQDDNSFFDTDLSSDDFIDDTNYMGL